jgi:hypothetical protein
LGSHSKLFQIHDAKRGWEQKLFKDAEKLGAAEGAAGRPSADTPEFDVGETTVRREVDHIVTGTRGRLLELVTELTPQVAQQLTAVTDCRLDFEQRRSPQDSAEICKEMEARRRDALVEAEYERYRCESEFNSFRHLNRVTSDPDHPADKLHYLSVVFILFAAEALLNSVFWTQSLSGFVTLGLLVAAALSALNIIIGFVAGIGFSYKNLHERKHQILGWGSLVIGVALGCWVNYFIITNRSVGPGPSPEDQAVQRVLSFAMFALGESFSLFALYKGYRFFGSIPGYEAASRRYLAAKARIQELLTELKSEFQQERRSQEDLRKRLTDKVSTVQGALAKLKAEIHSLATQYALSLQRLHQILEQSVNTYRRANRAVKPGNSASPSWFNSPVEALDPRDEGLAALQSHFTLCEAAAEELSKTIRSESAAEIAELQKVVTDFLGQRLVQLVADVEKAGLIKYEQSVKTVGNKGQAMAIA